ncbi:hypothetical protein SAY86_011735 [Trapa natans]|uniref:Uncharacterized protein n=1 Tax=Trapa natans TaxID=22666 RepID=A0AAN7LJF9_TRANT|nr:hypothetical protein SAY86_011735 [Trapa natans]
MLPKATVAKYVFPLQDFRKGNLSIGKIGAQTATAAPSINEATWDKKKTLRKGTVIITATSSGLGLATAKALFDKDTKSVGIPRKNYTMIHLYLASLDSSSQFVDNFRLSARLLLDDLKQSNYPRKRFIIVGSITASSTEGFLEGRFGTAMAGFEQQVKDRAYELKVLFKKGAKIVCEYGKKGWNKVKNIKR